MKFSKLAMGAALGVLVASPSLGYEGFDASALNGSYGLSLTSEAGPSRRPSITGTINFSGDGVMSDHLIFLTPNHSCENWSDFNDSYTVREDGTGTLSVHTECVKGFQSLEFNFVLDSDGEHLQIVGTQAPSYSGEAFKQHKEHQD